MVIKQRLLLLLLQFIVFNSITGQNLLQSNPISLSLANCNATLVNEWSGQSNPATAAQLKYASMALMYEQRYQLSELSTKGVEYIQPTHLGTFGGAVSQFGISQFNSSRYSVFYARRFGHRFCAGFQFNYWSDYVENSGHYETLFTDIGMTYHISKPLTLGCHLFNPEQSSISYPEYNVTIPGLFAIGINYQIISSINTYVQVNKSFENAPDFSTALEAHLNKLFSTRLGYSFNQQNWSGGLGLIIRQLSINLGFSYQQPLGTTSSASLAWLFNHKK